MFYTNTAHEGRNNGAARGIGTEPSICCIYFTARCELILIEFCSTTLDVNSSIVEFWRKQNLNEPIVF